MLAKWKPQYRIRLLLEIQRIQNEPGATESEIKRAGTDVPGVSASVYVQCHDERSIQLPHLESA